MQTAWTDSYGGGSPRPAARGATVASGRAQALRRSEIETRGGAGDRATRGAKALGWLSIGLGLTSLVFPRHVARLTGVPEDARSTTASRLVGARELLCGIGILMRPREPAWLWARVASDLVDLALLGGALGLRKANRPKVIGSMASVAGILVLDVLGAAQLGRAARRSVASTGRRQRRGSIRVTRSITVNRPPEDVYRFWRDLQNLPLFMDHLESVDVVDGQSHWRARGPGGSTVEWDATMIEDRPNELLAWRSIEGADVDNAGIVELITAPGDRGTVVRVALRYEPSSRRMTSLLAKVFGPDPARELESDLRRLKQVIETGEVVCSDASIHRGPHAARPPSNEEMSR